MIILMNSLKEGNKVLVSITRVFLPILLALIICTCSVQKLTLALRSSENQTAYSLYSGKRVSWIIDPMECVTSRIDGLALASWHPQNSFIKLQFPLTPGMAFYPRLVQMQRRCSQIRWYPYRSTTRFFSNQFRTVWTGQRLSWHTGYRHRSSPAVRSSRTTPPRNSSGSILPLTGRIPVKTPTTGRNSGYSPMMSRVNGRDRTTSSTTGGSRRQR